jgi:8-oxo-dGTP pyrophosphatase MutT (NUDIX family)
MGYVSDLRALVGPRPLILVAAGVLVLDGSGRVLLQRGNGGSGWTIPGGAMELGETLEETARRELREETGLEAGALTLLDVFSGPECFVRYPNGDQAYVVGAIYATRDARGEPTPDGEETTDLRYFPLEELPEPANALGRYVFDRCRRRLTQMSLDT